MLTLGAEIMRKKREEIEFQRHFTQGMARAPLS